jgi:hypothetical protein
MKQHDIIKRGVLALGVFAVGGWLLACQGSEFSGATGKKAPTDDKDDEERDEDILGQTSTNTQTQTSTGTPANPIDTGTDPGLQTMVDTGTGEGTPSLLDQLAGLLQTNQDVGIQQPNDNTIIVGQNQVFRIGDGQATDTTCQGEVLGALLAGVKFFFEFEVLDPNVNIEITSRVCGVDYDQTNKVSILRDVATQLATAPLPIGATSVVVPGQGLQPGKHVLVIESTANGGDFDDFMVGDITVRVTNANPNVPTRIRAGRVGAQ